MSRGGTHGFSFALAARSAESELSVRRTIMSAEVNFDCSICYVIRSGCELGICWIVVDFGFASVQCRLFQGPRHMCQVLHSCQRACWKVIPAVYYLFALAYLHNLCSLVNLQL